MRYWLGVASKDHVALGVADGFCQLCHGKKAPLQRMRRGDHILYYSPKQEFRSRRPCQAITACGVVTGDEVYQYEMFPGSFRTDATSSGRRRCEKCRLMSCAPCRAGAR